MRKGTLVGAAVIATMGVGLALGVSAETAGPGSQVDGQISFEGTVLPVGCELSIQGDSVSGSLTNASVQLPDVSTKDLGNTDGPGPSNYDSGPIHLKASCVGYTVEDSLTLTVTPGAVIGSDVLANQAGVGAALGVGIQLVDESDNAIPLAVLDGFELPLDDQGEANYKFKARYYVTAPSGGAGDGIVSASLQWIVDIP